MNDKIKHKILNCLKEDSGSFGLSVDDIASKIDNKDIVGFLGILTPVA